MKLVLLLFVLTLTSFAATRKMTCRGGGSMALWLKQSGYFRRVPFSDPTIYSMTVGELIFKKASSRHNKYNLPPGTCTWNNRPLNRNENGPVYLEYIGGSVEVVYGARGNAILTNRNEVEVGKPVPDRKPNSTVMKLDKAIKNQQYFEIDVEHVVFKLKGIGIRFKN